MRAVLGGAQQHPVQPAQLRRALLLLLLLLRAPPLLLLLQQEAGGHPGPAAGVQSHLGGAGENFQVRQKRAVFPRSAAGGPAAPGAPQLGAAAGARHGAGLRGLRHGGDAAAESAAPDFNAQQGAAESGPRGVRE